MGLLLNCKAIVSFSVPNGILEIEQNAFYGCTSLKVIEIPESLKAVAKTAFYGCSALSRIDYLGKEEDKATITIEEGNTAFSTILFGGAK
jgi:hypothetical protein